MARLIDIRSDSSRITVVAENVAYFDVSLFTGRDEKRHVRLQIFFVTTGKDLALFASTPETVTSMLTGILVNEEIQYYIERLAAKE